VERICAKWELPCTPIGDVSDTGELRALFEDELVGVIPSAFLTDECPRYDLEREPHSLEYVEPSPENRKSKAWIYEQYDQLVGSRTVRRPGLDAAVLRLRPGYRGLAVSLDGQGRMARLDPWAGGALAVLEAARNVACAGGEPLGITDCLNFGNPEKPEVAWELTEAVEGMAAACQELGIPVVSGNVSLYNETDGRAILPTPVVGAVGLVSDVRHVPSSWRRGDVILLAGASPVSLVGSEYQARYGEVGGRPPHLALAAEAALIEFLWRAAPSCSLVHDVSGGGLAVALAEAAIRSGVAAEVDLPDDARAWFGEGGGQAVLACAPDRVAELDGVPLRRLGVVGGERLLGLTLADLEEAYA
jgi:phosphoribosylformylglycinamidine (FGAM) synthase-like enzyme